jgi:hypothetical protein
MPEPDTGPAPAPARWTDYEISYTLDGTWTEVEWFRITGGPLVLADLPAMIASRHRYRRMSGDQVAVLRVEVVADETTGTVLHRWLRDLDQAQNAIELRMIGHTAEYERVHGPDAARRAQAEVFTRRMREREKTLTDPGAGAHCHSQGLGLGPQPLPGCLAPAPADRAAQPLLHMPYPGDPVVLYAGEVLWIQPRTPYGPLRRDNTVILRAPMHQERACAGAGWDSENLAQLDPDELGLDAGENEAIATAWDLLIHDANLADPDQPHDAEHPDLDDREPPIGQVVIRSSPTAPNQPPRHPAT